MTYSQDQLKKQVAEQAIKFVEDYKVIGVGTGSTVNYFIEALAGLKSQIEATVSSSKATTELLKKYGLPVYELNQVDSIPVYVDGADQALHYGQLIKGAGGALTQEKILVSCSDKFVCIIDETKMTQRLTAPVPVEVIPSARSLAGRKLAALGGDPVYRENYITDNGNIILDVERLDTSHPQELEEKINHIAGVVSNGIFAIHPADVILVATQSGVKQYPDASDYE